MRPRSPELIAELVRYTESGDPKKPQDLTSELVDTFGDSREAPHRRRIFTQLTLRNPNTAGIILELAIKEGSGRIPPISEGRVRVQFGLSSFERST